MSEEKTFRPERKPLTPNEMSPNEAQAAMQGAQDIRRMAEMNELDPTANESVQRPQMGPGGLPPGVVQGPIPPQFMKMMGMENPQTMPARQRPPAEVQYPGVPTDNKLAEVLASIKSATTTFEPVYLPSKGKFYDGEDGPQDGVIHIRPMTGQEEEILATPRFVKKGQAVNMIFNKCMQEKFSTEKFITADRTYLLIYLRGISYSPEYEVELKCPNCDRKFAYSIDLNDLYVDQCPDDFTVESLHGTLPTTGLEFRYRLSRGFDEQQVQDYRDRKMKGFDNAGQADDTLLYRTALLVEEIAGITDRNQIQRLLKELPISDVAHLRNVTSEPGFGVDTNVDIYCPGCTHDFTVDLPLEANFFFPRGKKTKKKA